MGRNSYTEVAVEFVHQTDSAVLVKDGDSKVWIPKSLIEEEVDEALEEGNMVELSVKEWFAEKQGMI